ncbi:MAG: hypothetical protein ABIO86_01235 [Sphingomonas sp.]
MRVKNVFLWVIAMVLAIAPAVLPAYPLGNASDPLQNSTEVPTGAPAPAPTISPTSQPGAITTTTAATAQNPDDAAIVKSIGILIRLFILAVILESALAVLFNWRPWLASFDGRTVNPLLTFVAALVLVRIFYLDEVGLLIAAYSTAPQVAGGWASSVVSALVIAGGSAGVNKMLRALGYRSLSIEADQPKPAPTEAWLAIINTSAVSVSNSFDILLSLAANPPAVIGTIDARNLKPPAFRWLFRDKRRFPGSGGFAVPLNTPVTISVAPSGAGAGTVIWGQSTLGAGAIVDIKVDLSKIS